tara:strand:+ start:339 stop:566 length:228 start_codon:yes stop_codon:yes gene_type:complete
MLRQLLQEINAAEGKRLLTVAMNNKAARIWKDAQHWESANPSPLTRVSAENPHRSAFSAVLEEARRLGVKIDIQA